MDKKVTKLVLAGAAAIVRTHKHWDDWVAIIPGLSALRVEATEEGTLKVRSRGYNERFGQLLDEHGYGEGLLEKNTRAALLSIGELSNWRATLTKLVKGMSAAERGSLTPRNVWDRLRPQDEDEEAPAAAEPAERGLSKARKAEEDLANQLDAAIVLQGDEDLLGRITFLYNNPELRPRLREVYEVLRAIFEAEKAPGTRDAVRALN